MPEARFTWKKTAEGLDKQIEKMQGKTPRSNKHWEYLDCREPSVKASGIDLLGKTAEGLNKKSKNAGKDAKVKYALEKELKSYHNNRKKEHLKEKTPKFGKKGTKQEL